MSINLLCVRISNCSRAFLFTCGDRSTVYLLIRVGRGTGPETLAPAVTTVCTIALELCSTSSTSKPLSLTRILSLAIIPPNTHLACAYTQARQLSICYSMISTTWPLATVRPPSRIANRSPFSMAIGLISSTEIEVLSPGITICLSSGRTTVPVMSVVRK